MNTLLIDVGNTRIKFGVTLPKGGYRYLNSCDTACTIAQLADFLATFNLVWGRVLGVCVAGDGVKLRVDTAMKSFGFAIKWLLADVPLPGLRNAYASPATLGSDRWLAAYGVAQAQLLTQAQTGQSPPAHSVLASFGTATTVDMIAWDAAQRSHVFVGGLILAGLTSSWRSVSLSTAQLPDVSALGLAIEDDNTASPAIPDRTDRALLLGAIFAQVGALERFCQTVTQQLGAPTLLVAGGAAPWVLPYLKGASTVAYPVLAGLAFASPCVA
jgi:type III pantothenate kinase